MIQLENISFSYGSGSAPVFSQLNLTLEPGRIYGLLGPNGSGKSTLLYMVAGLLRAREGRVLIDGRDAVRRSREVLSEVYIVPEEFDLPPMTLADYIATYRPFYPRFSDEVLSQCLAEFELPAQLHINRLSMGQKKKVLMAFALACGTRYLLMDEPTNGLDLQSKKQFRRVIASLPPLSPSDSSPLAGEQLDNDRTLIIATHQVHDVELLLDHVLILGRRSQETQQSSSRDNDQPSASVLCDATVSRLLEALSFSLQPTEPAPGEAFYYERTPLGYATIAPRRAGDEETPLNLELLYHAVQSEKLKMKSEKPTDANK